MSSNRRASSKNRRIVDGNIVGNRSRSASRLIDSMFSIVGNSVAGNVAFALPPEVKGRARRRALAEAALAEVDLGGFGSRDPDTLSGGQKARVALQRVLVSRPRLLLLDEPFSKLDMELRAQMRRLVFDRARAARLPVILVTHDASDAEAAGGAVFEMNGTS